MLEQNSTIPACSYLTAVFHIPLVYPRNKGPDIETNTLFERFECIRGM